MASSKRRPRKKNPRRPPTWKEAHWGREPTDIREVLVHEARDEKKAGGLRSLGIVHSIVYVTMKGGDREPTEYIHDFSRRDPPLLCFGAKTGKLYIVGGEYYVTSHGIIK